MRTTERLNGGTIDRQPISCATKRCCVAGADFIALCSLLALPLPWCLGGYSDCKFLAPPFEKIGTVHEWEEDLIDLREASGIYSTYQMTILHKD